MSRKESGAKAKFARYRETLRTTGPVSPGEFFHRQGEFATIPSPPLPSQLQTILRRLSMRFQGRAESIGPMWSKTKPKSKPNPGAGPTTSRWSAPGPGKRTRREDHALLIVRDEFRTGYSLIGLLASRARLRFTGTLRISSGRIAENRLSSNGNCVFSPVSHRRGSPHHQRLSAFICGLRKVFCEIMKPWKSAH